MPLFKNASKLRKVLQENFFLKTLSSLKINITCLSLLFILTFCGTIAQINQGLYLAQKTFFYSWFFLVLGFIPFPGAQLVLWVLFINLLCVALTKFQYRLSNIGILIIHIGLLTYLVSAFATFHLCEESNVTLMEHESTNVASAYHDWELSAWRESAQTVKKVFTYDTNTFYPGLILSFNDKNFNTTDFKITVKKFFPHSKAFTSTEDTSKDAAINASGIRKLTAIPFNKEPEKNVPGGMFEFESKVSKKIPFLLYGMEESPTALEHINFEPFILTLNDFQMEKHPGTEIARSYESHVTIEHDRLKREVVISMNQPLRYKDFTFYQASYRIDEWGREASTLAVVKNSARILPYLSSLITFLGLVTHFLMRAFTNLKRES